ncbi:unnamed protein product, partial [Symbiodinium natans]
VVAAVDTWLSPLLQMCWMLSMLWQEEAEHGLQAAKAGCGHTALYKIVGKAGFVPSYPAIFGRAHDFCVSMMDKKAGKDVDSDCSLPRFRTGETDEPEEDSASLCEFSDLDSEDMEMDGDLADVTQDVAIREVPEHVQDKIFNCARAVAACVLDGSCEHGEFQLISDGFEEEFGYTKQELCGKPVLRLLAEDTWAEYALDCHFNRVALEGARETITAPLRCKTGELISKTWTMEKVTVQDTSLLVLMPSSTEADGFKPADLFTA